MSKQFLHFAHNSKPYIYLVIVGTHCPTEDAFFKMFPGTRQVKERKFDKLYNRGHEIVTVGDKGDVDELVEGMEEDRIIRLS